jgi:5-methylcytosine-specific restriction endonuclease McrA
MTHSLNHNIPNDNSEYYCISITCDSDRSIIVDTISEFDIYTKTKPHREIRVPRLVKPLGMKEVLEGIYGDISIVNNIIDLYEYLKMGGYAIINTKMWELLPYSKASSESFTLRIGFESVLPTDRRRPSKKQRHEILSRDEYNCQKCGANPKDNKHVMLELHHIIPWGRGGRTTRDNMITLCRLCHTNLKPHYDRSLFDKLKEDDNYSSASIHRKEYEIGKLLYQELYGR